jgi:hypothetical protein
MFGKDDPGPILAYTANTEKVLHVNHVTITTVVFTSRLGPGKCSTWYSVIFVPFFLFCSPLSYPPPPPTVLPTMHPNLYNRFMVSLFAKAWR